jgi:ADP-heptose:LPS heptosyltransferase
MSNRLIYILETYVGYMLCLCLDVWHKVIRLFTRPVEFYHPAAGNLLFVKLIEQGALVLHYPALAEAVQRYGKERVFVCTFAGNRELLLLLNVLDPKNILCVNDKSLTGFALSVFRLLFQCKRLNIAAVIDLEFFSRTSAILCFLTGAPIRAGYHRFYGRQNYRGNLFTHRLNYSHYEHLPQTGVALLNSISVLPGKLPALQPIDKNTLLSAPLLPRLSEPDILNTIPRATRLVVVTPNLCDPLPLRQWPAQYYAACIKKLHHHHPDLFFLLAGRHDEQMATNAFIKQHNLVNVYNICGATDLTGLIAVYQRASLLLCSDSGPGHFAALTNTPCIVLFGPETPVLYGSTAPNVYTFYEKLPCSPCLNVYNNRLSPCANNLCMQNISVEKVVEKAMHLLSA